jgi:hypothetical protein
MMTFDGGTMRFNINPPMPLLASSGDRLFVASNEHYNITMYDVDRAMVGTLQRAVQRKPLTAADRMRVSREFGQMMDSVPAEMKAMIKMAPAVSDSLPVITALAAGDSLVLVRRGAFVSRDAPPATGTARWDVLGWDNHYRGYVDLPAGFSVSALREGRLYGVLTTGKTTSVVVMSLAPPANQIH